MRALAISATSLRRIARDRRALFLIVVLPILLILVLGLTLRNFTNLQVGLVDVDTGPVGQRVAAALVASHDLGVTRFPSESAADAALSRGQVYAVVVVPPGASAEAAAGHRSTMTVISEQANTTQQAAVTSASAILDEVAEEVQAAQFTVREVHVPYVTAERVAERVAGTVPVVAVTARMVARASTTLPSGFSYSAPTMLVLFVFMSAVSSGANLIEVRRLRLYERMLAAPVGPATVVTGEFLGLLAVALAQSGLIVALAALVFGVSWGSPLGAACLVLAWATVAAGAGLLGSTVFRTAEQASALGITFGIIFGMLGGCMWPLSIVSRTFREIGHATPHAWAVDAWTALLARHASLVGIAGDLGILAGVAVVLVALAATRLRRSFI